MWEGRGGEKTGGLHRGKQGDSRPQMRRFSPASVLNATISTLDDVLQSVEGQHFKPFPSGQLPLFGRYMDIFMGGTGL